MLEKSALLLLVKDTKFESKSQGVIIYFFGGGGVTGRGVGICWRKIHGGVNAYLRAALTKKESDEAL